MIIFKVFLVVLLLGSNLALINVNAAPIPQWADTPKVEQIKVLSLKDAIFYSFARSPVIEQAAAQMGLNSAQIKEAQSAWYPKVSLNGSSGLSKQSNSNDHNSSISYGLTLTQLVYDFGRTSNNINKQKSISIASYYKMLSVMNDVGEKTTLAYINVKRSQDLRRITEENINSLTSIKEMAQLRADAGLSSHSDVLQAETRIASMYATLEQYKAELNTAISQLFILTGIEATTLPDYPEALIVQPVKLDTINYSTHSLTQSAESYKNATNYDVDTAKSQYWPTVNLQSGRTRNNGGKDSYWNDQVELSVSVPIYQGGAISSRVQQTEAIRRAAISEVNQVKLDINQKASAALANWMGAYERELIGEKQFFTAVTARDVYKNEYKLGNRSLTDLLSVEQDIHQASVAKLTADYDGWNSAVNYAAAVDNLLPLLGILRKQQNELPNL